jgi:hypothetical protein
MKWFNNISCLFFVLIFTVSCTKDVSLDIPKEDSKLVVQASIENGLPPFVLLTKSVNYFDSTILEAFEKTIVLDAKVTISDGTRTLTLDTICSDTITGSRLQKLAEYLSVPVENLKRVRYCIYSFKSISNFLVGEVGKTYTLKIEYEGKTYTASTIINLPIKLDSLWYRAEPSKENLGYISTQFSEPKGLGNCYRWMAKRYTKDSYFISPLGTTFQDKLVDGKTFEFYAQRGSPQNSDKPEDKNGERGLFRNNDTVIVKFASIDVGVFNFYRTYDVEIANRGNPFAAPTTVQTNISNGGLGIFAGYGTYIDTVYLGK